MQNKQILPGTLAVSILFWSWTVSLWPLGIGLAILLEAPRWLHWRFAIEDKDLIQWLRLILVSNVLILASLLVIQLDEGIYTFVQWFPLLFFPIILLQIYHRREVLPVSVLIAAVNKRSFQASDHIKKQCSKKQSVEKQSVEKQSTKTIDLRLFFIFQLLIASSISAPSADWVFIFYFCTVTLSIYHVRPKNFHNLGWFGVISLVFLLTFLIKNSLTELQSYVEDITTEWLSRDWSNTDVFKSYTTMGQIGELKLSNKIIMRIKSSERRSRLLQQANYGTYGVNSWYLKNTDFQVLRKNLTTNSWRLTETTPTKSQRLIVSAQLKQGKGVLALPRGSYVIFNTRPGELSKNSSNSVRIDKAPVLLDYTVYFGASTNEEANEKANEKTNKEVNEKANEKTDKIDGPNQSDLHIPASLHKTINQFVAKLKLDEKSPSEAISELGAYFERHFSYSLIQRNKLSTQDSLDYFLNTSHKGHCEFYATAGALILRAIGIPTRYATGYAMTEYDVDSDSYVVRQRHAHAWVLANVNKQWVELDYTPSTWAELEAVEDPWWQGAADFIDLKIDELNRWRDINGSFWIYGLLVGTIFIVFIVKKWFSFGKTDFNWQLKRIAKNTVIRKTKKPSPFYELIDYLETTIDCRKPEETLCHWLRRIENKFTSNKHNLDGLLQQHYEIIYGDVIFTEIALQRFQKEVKTWIEK